MAKTGKFKSVKSGKIKSSLTFENQEELKKEGLKYFKPPVHRKINEYS